MLFRWAKLVLVMLALASPAMVWAGGQVAERLSCPCGCCPCSGC